MTEADVSSKLRVCLIEGGAKAMKVSDRFHAGRPDLFICHLGRFIAIETKIYPNQPTFIQAQELTDFVQHGAQAYIASYDKRARILTMTSLNDGVREVFKTIKDASTWLLTRSSLHIKREALNS
jgi:Holliday junction resolvase